MRHHHRLFATVCCVTFTVLFVCLYDVYVNDLRSPSQWPASLRLDKHQRKFNKTEVKSKSYESTNKTIRAQRHLSANNLKRRTSTEIPIIPTTSGFVVRSRAHIVIIASYMRSGSTLTGHLMQHFPKTFYVYEPFHALHIRSREGKTVTYLNGTQKAVGANVLDNRQLMRDELMKWLDCRLEELDAYSLADKFHLEFSTSMRKFAKCWQEKRKTIKSLRNCLPVAKKLCEEATTRLFKFIRIPLDLIESVFEEYPNLQVIHLLRDPRAVLRSQVKVKKITWAQIPQKAREHCTRISDDLASTFTMHNQYPDRVKILLYERLAENPLDVSSKMYTFINKPMYKTLVKYIEKITKQRASAASGSFGVLSVNSTRTAYSWRDELNITSIQTIDTYCGEIYSKLGYLKFSNEKDAKDHNLPTLRAPDFNDIFI
ncbi:carbohydrate sulfotransferase 5-like [Mya arenaria]|uniref:carbohydrate sulfotransferase 5-like n=1 Tax=Mya arenaria TaxID=6604 RepID=UPI0022E32189|nr:carbohydrate sulfotransferase 5-like [Mya arenaria]XP_052790540.1 carbohydrate sulfotransferase 5-like [Mya arenaria]